MDLKEIKVTDKKLPILRAMGITKVEDLLTHYPHRYEFVEEVPFEKWEKETKIAIEGIITNRARVVRFGGRSSMTKFRVLWQEREFDVSIFNRPWVNSFKQGNRITILGKYDGSYKITAYQTNSQPLKDQLGMQPIYTTKEGLTLRELKTYINRALDRVLDQTQDLIPKELHEKYRLVSRKQALYNIHRPKDQESLKQSLRYLKYEEFFRFQLTMQVIKAKETKIVHGHAKQFEIARVMDLKRTLPFSLTNDQESTIMEILEDLQADKVMYRMVQGDVGCGKTLVAAFGLYACVLSHKQAAFMAPTEILAKQHYRNLIQVFKDSGVRVEVLYSSLKAYEKRAILQRLKSNEIDIIVGTHALFQEHVEFHDLGMVVADEQHRFGVEQRRKLIEKGEKVDFLLMSATPIPRTLALSLFGDMDVSTIQELPAGRMPITTQLVKSKSMGPILEDVLKLIDEGNQCYVVCPAIEKNEDFDLRNVNDIYEGMRATLGRKYRIGLLHGKMSADEKDRMMNAFVQGHIQILVSTTVIEVGVDVKDANIMVIYDAHRFGLSQIHQLRGRIGRGNKPGYCYLLSSSKDEDSLKRLEICVETSDGFEIARQDLLLRGPGDILGTRQSGVPGFVLGDVILDAKILEAARDDAVLVLKHLSSFPYIQKYINENIGSGSYLD